MHLPHNAPCLSWLFLLACILSAHLSLSVPVLEGHSHHDQPRHSTPASAPLTSVVDLPDPRLLTVFELAQHHIRFKNGTPMYLQEAVRRPELRYVDQHNMDHFQFVKALSRITPQGVDATEQRRLTRFVDLLMDHRGASDDFRELVRAYKYRHDRLMLKQRALAQSPSDPLPEIDTTFRFQISPMNIIERGDYEALLRRHNIFLDLTHPNQIERVTRVLIGEGTEAVRQANKNLQSYLLGLKIDPKIIRSVQDLRTYYLFQLSQSRARKRGIVPPIVRERSTISLPAQQAANAASSSSTEQEGQSPRPAVGMAPLSEDDQQYLRRLMHMQIGCGEAASAPIFDMITNFLRLRGIDDRILSLEDFETCLRYAMTIPTNQSEGIVDGTFLRMYLKHCGITGDDLDNMLQQRRLALQKVATKKVNDRGKKEMNRRGIPRRRYEAREGYISNQDLANDMKDTLERLHIVLPDDPIAVEEILRPFLLSRPNVMVSTRQLQAFLKQEHKDDDFCEQVTRARRLYHKRNHLAKGKKGDRSQYSPEELQRMVEETLLIEKAQREQAASTSSADPSHPQHSAVKESGSRAIDIARFGIGSSATAPVELSSPQSSLHREPMYSEQPMVLPTHYLAETSGITHYNFPFFENTFQPSQDDFYPRHDSFGPAKQFFHSHSARGEDVYMQEMNDELIANAKWAELLQDIQQSPPRQAPDLSSNAVQQSHRHHSTSNVSDRMLEEHSRDIYSQRSRRHSDKKKRTGEPSI